MFLDDELEAIYKGNGFSEETSFQLVHACIKRIPKPGAMSPECFLNEVRKIEGGWKLFCKRHPEYNPNGFRELLMIHFGWADKPSVIKYLHWDK